MFAGDVTSAVFWILPLLKMRTRCTHETNTSWQAPQLFSIQQRILCECKLPLRYKGGIVCVTNIYEYFFPLGLKLLLSSHLVTSQYYPQWIRKIVGHRLAAGQPSSSVSFSRSDRWRKVNSMRFFASASVEWTFAVRLSPSIAPALRTRHWTNNRSHSGTRAWHFQIPTHLRMRKTYF